MVSEPVKGYRFPELKPLLCPYCGDGLTISLVYTGGAYSENREMDGIECDNSNCDAAWKPDGKPIRSTLGRTPADDPYEDKATEDNWRSFLGPLYPKDATYGKE